MILTQLIVGNSKTKFYYFTYFINNVENMSTNKDGQIMKVKMHSFDSNTNKDAQTFIFFEG